MAKKTVAKISAAVSRASTVLVRLTTSAGDLPFSAAWARSVFLTRLVSTAASRPLPEMSPIATPTRP